MILNQIIHKILKQISSLKPGFLKQISKPLYIEWKTEHQLNFDK